MSRFACALTLLIPWLCCAQQPALDSAPAEERVVPDEHIREELGVNAFTAPAIAEVFQVLDLIRPLNYEAWKRPLDDAQYPDRIQLALNFGVLIAEGFFAVENEKRQEIEDIGRLLLKRGNAIGVGDRITRHSKRMLALSGTGDWKGLRTELAKTQTDVENSLLELRDEELAHMIALGGWLRGLEIVVRAVNADFKSEHAEIIRDVEKVDYFIDRLDTLHPDVKRTPLISGITSQLKTIHRIFTARPDKPLFPSDTAEVEKIIVALNERLREP